MKSGILPIWFFALGLGSNVALADCLPEQSLVTVTKGFTMDEYVAQESPYSYLGYSNGFAQCLFENILDTSCITRVPLGSQYCVIQKPDVNGELYFHIFENKKNKINDPDPTIVAKCVILDGKKYSTFKDSKTFRNEVFYPFFTEHQ